MAVLQRGAFDRHKSPSAEFKTGVLVDAVPRAALARDVPAQRPGEALDGDRRPEENARYKKPHPPRAGVQDVAQELFDAHRC